MCIASSAGVSSVRIRFSSISTRSASSASISSRTVLRTTSHFSFRAASTRCWPAMKQVAFIGGTVGKAIERFKGSPEYLNDLRPSSRYIYDRAFDIMRDKIGATLLSDFADVDVVDVYSAGMSVPRWVKREVRGTMKKVRQGGPASADLHITLLSMIWRYAASIRSSASRASP